MPERTATINRQSSETRIELSLNLDGSGTSRVSTGIGALDHFLTLFARHGLFDLAVTADGDLEVDGHHTTEDVAICLGQAINQALADHRGVKRTADVAVPMDESLAHAAIDLSGRSAFVMNGSFDGFAIGQLETDLVRHFFDTLSREGRMNIHFLVLYGQNDHHKAEAMFKAFGRALDAASAFDPRLGDRLPSTKDLIEGSS